MHEYKWKQEREDNYDGKLIVGRDNILQHVWVSLYISKVNNAKKFWENRKNSPEKSNYSKKIKERGFKDALCWIMLEWVMYKQENPSKKFKYWKLKQQKLKKKPKEIIELKQNKGSSVLDREEEMKKGYGSFT